MPVSDPTPRRYHYDAVVLDIVDGDTVTLDVDLGLYVWRRKERIRLYGIDTPEIVGVNRAAGLAAREFLAKLIAQDPNRRVVVETIKDGDDKFGRLLGVLFVKDATGAWLCVNDELINAGHAKAWNGKGEKP